jgi:putative transposase
MRRIDELHLEHPFMGSRQIVRALRREGLQVGRLHVRALLQKMGLQALGAVKGYRGRDSPRKRA